MSWIYTMIVAGILFSGSTTDNFPSLSEFTPARSLKAAAVTTADETERFEQTYPLTANGRVNVANINGPITIEAWDRSEVRLEAVKTADTRELLTDLEIKVDSRPDSFSVTADHDKFRGRRITGKLEVEFKLHVPRSAVIDRVGTVNGTVTASGLTNGGKFSTVNGHLSIVNFSGSLQAETVNGTIDADLARVDASSRISLRTVNGRAGLEIPADTNATVSADALSGTIQNDLGIQVSKSRFIGRRLNAKLGDGSAAIRISTVNGQISLERKNDGRPAVPVTDLSKNDPDADFDDSAMFARSAETLALAQTHAKQQTLAARQKQERALREAARAVARSSQPDLDGDELKKASEELAASLKSSLPNIELRAEDLAKLKEFKDLKDLKDFKDLKPLPAAVIARTLSVPGAFSAAWSWNENSAMSIVRKSKSFPVKGTPTVRIEAPGYVVRVRGWDKAEVGYEMVDVGSAASDVSVTEDVSSDEVKLSFGAADPYRDRARIDVFVPRKANVKVISDREIRVEGVKGSLDLEGEQGCIDVRDSAGTLNVRAAESTVRVIGFTGDVTSNLISGDLYLQGTLSSVRSNTSDGDVILTLPADASADLKANVDSIRQVGVKDVRKIGDGHWQIGSGRAIYQIQLGGGRLILQSDGSLAG